MPYCEKCGWESDSYDDFQTVKWENGSGTFFACDECVQDFHFEASLIKENENVDILEILQKKLVELKEPELFRDENLICILQSAVNEIISLRSFKFEVDIALNSGDGSYKP